MRKAVASLAAGLVVLLAGAVPRADQAPTAAELARRVQDYYKTVADFTADFVGTFRYEMTHQVSVERGGLKVKKPNRMRWTYTKPDRKEFVADGKQLFAYFPDDKIGSVTPLPEAGDASLALLFLAGKGDLTRDFVTSMPPEQPPTEWRLSLAPLKRQDDYTSLTMIVRRDSLALAGLAIVDEEGTQTFQFTNFQTNRGLKDSDFHFVFPKGTIKR